MPAIPIPRIHSDVRARERRTACACLAIACGLTVALHPGVEEQRAEGADGGEHVEQIPKTWYVVEMGDGESRPGRYRSQRTRSPVASTPMSRSYIVRTYGCQMNEHDSERIAGLLEADGLVRADSEADADVVVLNTCCIRENADNKLYGNLGHLKTWKGKKDGRQIVVSGCLAQKDQELRRRPRRGTSTSSWARTTSTAPPSCSAQAEPPTGPSPRSCRRR